jgi:CheY-like chemotaxis protein
MSSETRARVFDPFFTTKSAGHGLGLAVVDGIVRGLHGAIHLASEPGQDTTVQVLLPCAATSALDREDNTARREPAPSDGDAGTILIVEDEIPLRGAVTKMLRKRGFEVIECGDGFGAIDALRAQGGTIDAILLDMTIPGPSSREVIEEAIQWKSDVRVVLTSAYSQEMLADMMDTPQIRTFLRKPVPLSQLLQTLQDVLAHD